MTDFSELVALVQEHRDGARAKQQASSSLHQQQIDSFINAPIFSSNVYKFAESTLPSNHSISGLMPQYGLVGVHQDPRGSDILTENRLVLANTNIPWSTFICGSQGAGKSHTLSCLLENALIKNNAAGKLSHPLAAMVVHYDNYSNYETTQICEAAYLCSAGIPVTVLVSPSNIWAMKRLYSNLPGLQPNGPQPRVVPLYIEENQLDISRILKLMAVRPTSKECPLYMHVVMNVARELAMEGPGFSFTEFRQRLANIKWGPSQQGPLNMRLDLLDSFIAPSETTRGTKPAKGQDIWAFEPGSVTIIDLSDPFVSSDDACTLFAICLSIFLEGRNVCGRIVALDEAHKFLGQSGEAEILTNDLTSIIRQQRHTGTRVLIATQEPTLSPMLMDLANATFVHRFLSPAWYETLKKHLAGANRQNSDETDTLFDTIVALRTGEALLFCPTAQVSLNDSIDGYKDLQALGNNFIKVKIRERLTADGGRSIMATDRTNIPMIQRNIESVPMNIVQSKPKDFVKTDVHGVGHKAPAATIVGSQGGGGAKIQAAVSTSTIPKENYAKTNEHQGSSKEIPSGPSGKSSASKVQPMLTGSKTLTTLATTPKAPVTSTTSTAPKTSAALNNINMSPTTKEPTELAMKQLSAEAERQASAIFKGYKYKSTSSLSKIQRDKIHSDVETNLKLPSNILVKEGPWKYHFYRCLNTQLVKLSKQTKGTHKV